MAGREAIRECLRRQMLDARSRHLERMAAQGATDRGNGSYDRHWLTEMGVVLLRVPRTRTWSPIRPLQAYGRRSKSVDRAILGCFLLGLSTRKVARALLPMLGEPVSATTVSNISKTLDAAVAAFHRRPIRQPLPRLDLRRGVPDKKDWRRSFAPASARGPGHPRR